MLFCFVFCIAQWLMCVKSIDLYEHIMKINEICTAIVEGYWSGTQFFGFHVFRKQHFGKKMLLPGDVEAGRLCVGSVFSTIGKWQFLNAI